MILENVTRSGPNFARTVTHTRESWVEIAMQKFGFRDRSVCAGVAMALTLAACASDRSGEPSRVNGGRGERNRAELNVFISPAGKPYRAGAREPYPVAAWFAAADADHDGRLSRAEFVADAERFFHELDADHDGVIDGFEVQTYEQKVAPEILPSPEGLHAGEGMDTRLLSGRGRRGGEPSSRSGAKRRILAGDRSPQGAALYGVLDEPEPVTAADADFSGRITLDEWRAKASTRFDLLDGDGRGYLTLQRLPTTAAQDILARLQKRDAAKRARGGAP